MDKIIFILKIFAFVLDLVIEILEFINNRHKSGKR